MAFIKAQKIIYDESGKITSGSASVVDTIYVKTTSKEGTHHIIRQSLLYFCFCLFGDDLSVIWFCSSLQPLYGKWKRLATRISCRRKEEKQG